MAKGGEHEKPMTNENFHKVVEAYQGLVFTICLNFVHDREEALNLAQDTFLSAYRAIDGCDARYYKPWLARIAANKAKDFLKSAYYRHEALSPLDDPIEPVFTGPGAEESVLSSEGARLIAEKIRALKEPYHKVSVLFFLEERTISEIAAALGRPEKTVRTQLARARQKLQEAIKQMKEEEV